MRPYAFVAVAAVAMLTVPAPATAGDPVAGRRIAERWCSPCHVVAGGRSGSDAAPSLEGIGRRRHDDPDWVRGWLAAPHPPMPDLSLTRDEIEDVVAYLESLSR